MNVATTGTKVLKIFLSHKSIDYSTARQIAAALKTKGSGSLKLAYSGEMSIFGEDYREWIENNLEEAEWYILAYTEPFKNWDWCLYEAGYFEACQKAKRKKGNPRIICLHPDEQRPKPLQKFDSIPINDRNKLRQFCEWFIRRVNPDLERDARIGEERDLRERLEAAFRNRLKTLFQRPELKVTVTDPGALGANDLPDDALVEADSALMSMVFDYNDDGAPWSRLRRSPATKDKRWVAQLVHGLHNANNRKHPQPITGNIELLTSGESLLPVLTRVDRLADTSLQCGIVFADGITPRWAALRKAHIRALLTSIRMTIRFRYDLIDRFVGQTALVAGQLGPLQLRETFRNLIFDITSEAEAHGFSDPNVMLACFQSAKDREEVAGLLDAWGKEVQPQLFRALGMSTDREVWTQFDDSPFTTEQIETIEQSLSRLREMNSAFLDLALERYRHLVQSGEA